jgi:hypothetical protein
MRGLAGDQVAVDDHVRGPRLALLVGAGLDQAVLEQPLGIGRKAGLGLLGVAESR